MLYPFVPKRSGPHRIAAIALYRALLTKCRESPLEQDKKDALQNVIRHRFKKNRHVCSKRILSYAFQGGYQGIDLLDAARAVDTRAISKIQELLDAIPAFLKQPTKPSPLLREPKLEDPLAEPKPPPRPYTSILSRPYPKVSGKRHVPVLVVTGGIPWLRTQKPQPHHLTGYLAHRKKKRQDRVEFQQELLKTALPIAQREDEWDQILSMEYGDIEGGNSATEDTDNVKETHFGEGGGSVEQVDGVGELETAAPGLESTWTYAVKREGIYYLAKLLRDETHRNNDMIHRMWAIVKAERELADEENLEWRRRKRIERIARREASAEAADATSDTNYPTPNMEKKRLENVNMQTTRGDEVLPWISTPGLPTNKVSGQGRRRAVPGMADSWSDAAKRAPPREKKPDEKFDEEFDDSAFDSVFADIWKK